VAILKTTMLNHIFHSARRAWLTRFFCALIGGAALVIEIGSPAQAEEAAAKPPPETRPAEASINAAKRIDPTDFKHRFDLRSEYIDYGSASMMMLVPRVEYAFSNSLAVRAELPVLRYDPGSSDSAANGVGNLLTRLAWRVTRNESYAMVIGSMLSFDTASNANLGSGKHVLAPFAFWAIDLPAMKSVFFPYIQYGSSLGGDSSREDVHYTNLRTSLLTRWPDRTYSFIEIDYLFDHERSNNYSSYAKAELGRFVLPKTGFYLRPGAGMSGTNERLGIKWSMEIGMRHFF
jgi:hypothetical protein